DSLRKLRFGIQQSHRSFDFRRPDETNGPERWRQLAFVNQLLQRPRYLQDGDAAAGIVVGAGPLVIEMTTESNLLLLKFGIGAGNSGCDNFIVAGMLAGSHRCVHSNLLAASQTLTQRTTGFE